MFEKIWNYLQEGKSFGYYSETVNKALGNYIWNHVLYIEGNYIRWSYYGSSAEKITKENLRWILKNIFEMTPAEFLEKYQIYNGIFTK